MDTAITVGAPDGRGWWVLAAVLAVVELSIAALMMFPQISAGYRAYYITNQAPCYLEDGQPRIEIGHTVGATRRFAVTRCLFDASWTPEQHGTVLKSSAGHLRFRLPQIPTDGLRLTLAGIATGRYRPARVSLSANGQHLGTFSLSRSGNGLLSTILPVGTTVDGQVDLTVRLLENGRASVGKGRFMLLRWRLDPASAAAPNALPPAGYY